MTIDLFQRLRVIQGNSETVAARLDIGWRAWLSRLPPPGAGRAARWRFLLALALHFGQARYLVRIDNSYHTATGVRVRQQSDGGLEVQLVQTDSLWLCLIGRWRQKLGRPAPSWLRTLRGSDVLISRYPLDLAAASVPATRLSDACPEALLDLQRALALPLQVLAR